MNYILWQHHHLFFQPLEAIVCFFCVLLTLYLVPKIKRFMKKRQHLLMLPGVKSDSYLLGHLKLLMKVKKSLPSKSATQAYFKMIDDMGIEFQEKKEGCFRLDLTPLKSVIHLIRKETADKILTQSAFIDKSFQYDLISNWLGSSLLTSGGETWKGKRKLLSRGFHNRSLQSFVPIIEQHAKRLCHQIRDRMKNQCKSSREVTVRDPHKIFLKTTLDIILDATMDIPSSDDDHSIKEYTENLHEYSILYIKRVSCPWLWWSPLHDLTESGRKMNSCIRSMRTFTDNIIRRRTQQTDKSKSCLLDLVLESFPLEEARNEVDTFIFAGHDTTGLAIFYTLFLIGHHEEIQERLYQELLSHLQAKDNIKEGGDDEDYSSARSEKVTGNGKDILVNKVDNDSREFTTTIATTEAVVAVTKNKLPLLEAVIKESLRLFPPVPIIGRQINQEVKLNKPCLVSQDYVEGDERRGKNKNIYDQEMRVKRKDEQEGQDDDAGLDKEEKQEHEYYVIPKGTSLTIDIYRIHRDPNVFFHPDSFHPDRFLGEEGNKSIHDVFMPFSAGLRSCIGSKLALMEMKIILLYVISCFSIQSVTPIDQLNLSQEIVLKPNNPDIMITFKERSRK